MDAPTLTPDVVAAKPDIKSSPDPSPLSPAQPLPLPGAAPPGGKPVQIVRTPALIASMIAAAKDASDLIFSPGRAPQVDMYGGLIQLKVPGVGVLTPEDTARIAADLIGRNSMALQKLKEQGSCDISYSLPKVSRFRVNVFTQRGTCAIVMRIIPSSIPDFKSLGLPEQIGETAALRSGIVLVTGPTGSGKSSTLAAILNKINEEQAHHIITIEDPIEFLHPHKRATIHQRELHSDTPSFALALRASLRQAPKVILVGEMRDRETIEVALEAAETGHVVFSTLHTTDAPKTIERIIGVFPLADQSAIRNRLAKTFRYIISQRLLPRLDGKGRIAAFEILKSTMRTRDYVEKGETEGKSLLDAMRDGDSEGMQYFDGEIEKLIRAQVIDVETGLSYATNSGNLRLQLGDLIERDGGEGNFPSAVMKPIPLRDKETEIER